MGQYIEYVDGAKGIETGPKSWYPRIAWWVYDLFYGCVIRTNRITNTDLHLKLPNKELTVVKISGISLKVVSLRSLLTFKYLSALYQNF